MDRLLGVGRPFSNIHTVAWGTASPYYGSMSRNLDSYMYANQDFLVVIAAGNKDELDDSLSDPATSKNALVGKFFIENGLICIHF